MNEKSIEEYYKNPNICKFCGKIIEVKNEKDIWSIRNKKFCNTSCSAKYNNKIRKFSKIKNKCLNCGTEVDNYKKKYCNNKCQQEYNYKKYISRWKNGLENGNKGLSISKHIRKYIFDKYDNKCAECGWNKINPHSNSLPLEIEHIDGNFLNNKEENLTLLCPNCHSLTKTFGALNMGNGRKSRLNRLGRTLYNKEDYEKLDHLSMRLGIECWMKDKEDEKINNIIEEIIQIYKKY